MRKSIPLYLLSITLTLAFLQPTLATDRLLVFGDSWGVGSYLGLEKAFAVNAPGSTVVPAAIAGETASAMNSSDPAHGLPYITNTLAANPTVDMMHLSIGGNDILFNWTAAVPPAVEDALLSSIVDDIEEVVLHALAQRSDLNVFYSSYDYFRPLPFWGTPLEVNTVFEDLHNRVASRLASNPRVFTHNFNGLMQELHGYSPLGLLPGDPSLPDINLPGPPEPFFDEIHLSWDINDGSPGPFGFDQFANRQFEVFYQSRLIPEPQTAFLLIFASCTLLNLRCTYFRKPR